MAIYNGKHVVFEQVGLDSGTLIWNSSSNVDSDNCSNDWNISNMRRTYLPAHLLSLSQLLQDNLTETTIQTATNGNNGTLVSTSDKLFIAAEKEMTINQYYARTEENNALTTWNYWTTHNQASDRIKTDPSNVAQRYWLRSPGSGKTGSAVYFNNGGYISMDAASERNRISLCYAF